MSVAAGFVPGAICSMSAAARETFTRIGAADLLASASRSASSSSSSLGGDSDDSRSETSAATAGLVVTGPNVGPCDRVDRHT